MTKSKISLSLDEKLIKRLDSFVDDKVLTSRSDVVESFLESYLDSNRVAVVLAGGDPANLWIKELGTYRPLVEINGKTLIEDIVEKILQVHIRKVVVVGSKETTTAIFKKIGNGESLSCEIIYVEEKEHKHTANTLKLAEKFSRNTFLFVPCDHFFNFDLKKLEQVHKLNNFVTTLAIYGGTTFLWNKTSLVELDGNHIVNYWEYPKTKTSHLISTFIGFAEPEIFSLIPNKVCSLQNDIYPQLVKTRKLGGVILSGDFVNVHTKNDVELVKRILEAKK